MRWSWNDNEDDDYDDCGHKFTMDLNVLII